MVLPWEPGSTAPDPLVRLARVFLFRNLLVRCRLFVIHFKRDVRHIKQESEKEFLMKKFSAVLIAAVLALTSVAALAHSGGTDSKGCHRNHKTGDYHCH